MSKMRQLQSFFTLLAFLCSSKFGHAGEAHDFYLDQCKKAFPDLQDVDAIDFQMEICTYTCTGTTKDNTKVSEVRDKLDGAFCYSSELFGEERTHECFKGSCLPDEDVDACRANIQQGELVSLEYTECAFICQTSDGQKKKILMEQGRHCSPEGHTYDKASCNNFGVCLRDGITVVSDPKGGTTASKEVAQAVCDSRSGGDADADVYFMYSPQPCEFLCQYGTENEILTFQNGYTCDTGKQCVVGGCRETEDIERCKSLLGETLNDMVNIDCIITCVGETKKESFPSAPNRDCQATYPFKGSYVNGVCDVEGACVFDD